eukprot:scaffold6142_cov116-Cylindrotheca_fusiformis.AAC.7
MNGDQSLASKKTNVTFFSSSSSIPTRDAADSASKDHTRQRESYQPPEVAKLEEANILRAKVFVALIILLAASAVGASTYLFVKDQEQKNFENQADQFFSALDAFSNSIASQADTENELRNTSWPFYAVPDWSIKARGLAQLTGVSEPEVFFSPIVQAEDREKFNEFASQAVPKWYQESVEMEKSEMTATELWQRTIPFIHFYDPENNFQPGPSPVKSESIPLLQIHPASLLPGNPVMPTLFDTSYAPGSDALANMSRSLRKPVMGFTVINVGTDAATPGNIIIQPIYDTANSDAEDRKVVAFTGIRLHWLDYFKNVLTDGDFGVIVVLQSSCPNLCTFAQHMGSSASSVVTYRIDGQNAEYLGDSDLHNPKYEGMEITDVFVDLGIDESELPEGTCIPTLTLHIYPSDDLAQSFQTSSAIQYTGVVAAACFIFTSLVFLLYDYFVQRRQKKVMERIRGQDRIMANIFPSTIRDRLYQSQEKQQNDRSRRHSEHCDFNDDSENLDFEGDSYIPAPMADLFPSVSVVFADIVGFTAWSSAREPQQVFVLLETIYGAFDKIAYRHSVFKVETVGDCYVSAVGLPEPVHKHAVVACKFARECKMKMIELTLKLEVSLGPDTGDLDLRTGIHSGQVTAGVLRGERSRFQLFGDTMNTAARMEQTGEPHRIHLSQASADLLKEAGLGRWIMPRSTKIIVKGKGHMQTYWLRRVKARNVKGSDKENDMITVAETDETEEESYNMEEAGLAFAADTDQGMTKIERLVEWNVEVLGSLLQQIMASRSGVVTDTETLSRVEKRIFREGGTVLDEFTPIIRLKRLTVEELRARRRPSSIDIGDEVKSQLRSFLSEIAAMYRENPFHNFHHASHVTASVKKLLTRIVKVGEGNGLAPASGEPQVPDNDLVDLAGHCFGITNDPLTQFAVVFSAIIHDVDHPGVPNAQLVKEKTRNAEYYKKSVAEQNSVELAWDMLMSGEYSALRACIYQTESDLQRFRQLVVNTVLATDIADKELQALRKNRWEVAFSSASPTCGENQDDRKATIVIEHLIQASDVSHTMQHWHIYKEWNE